jgi:hypothetical protein
MNQTQYNKKKIDTEITTWKKRENRCEENGNVCIN